MHVRPESWRMRTHLHGSEVDELVRTRCLDAALLHQTSVLQSKHVERQWLPLLVLTLHHYLPCKRGKVYTSVHLSQEKKNIVHQKRAGETECHSPVEGRMVKLPASLSSVSLHDVIFKLITSGF